jgi:hypothetical protein
MPVCWSLEPPARRVVLTVTDPYTFHEWEEAVSTLLIDRACGSWRAFLVDRRQSSPPTTEFIRRMADFFSVHAAEMGNSRVAVVVSSEVGFGMSRMAQMSAEARNPSITIRTFRTYEDGERWLTAGQPAM